MNITIREYRGSDDARPQYELWLRATADLPRAWRSSLRNVEHQLEQAVRYPGCRLYAERSDGTLLGYIANHPPFEWMASQHGPPSESLGWAVPFGYPWTHPLDETLEIALYDAMICATPEAYADSKCDIYIQRFRESWSRHLTFLESRGWRRHARLPLLGRTVDDPGQPPSDLFAIERDDLALVSTLSQQDETAADAFTTDDLRQRYDGGWIANDTFWRLGQRGAFAIEQRGPWACVTLLLAQPNAWKETLRAAAAQAGGSGAREIYFTIDAHATKLHDALDRQGFREVDAGVYYIRDAAWPTDA